MNSNDYESGLTWATANDKRPVPWLYPNSGPSAAAWACCPGDDETDGFVWIYPEENKSSEGEGYLPFLLPKDVFSLLDGHADEVVATVSVRLGLRTGTAMSRTLRCYESVKKAYEALGRALSKKAKE